MHQYLLPADGGTWKYLWSMWSDSAATAQALRKIAWLIILENIGVCKPIILVATGEIFRSLLRLLM